MTLPARARDIGWIRRGLRVVNLRNSMRTVTSHTFRSVRIVLVFECISNPVRTYRVLSILFQVTLPARGWLSRVLISMARWQSVHPATGLPFDPVAP
jgi:hypothetical protein